MAKWGKACLGGRKLLNRGKYCSAWKGVASWRESGKVGRVWLKRVYSRWYTAAL